MAEGSSSSSSSSAADRIVVAVVAVIGLGLLLTVILVPASLGYVEYYEYGLDQFRITRSVDTETVYPPGRHLIGPAHGFLKYRRDAHLEHLDGLSVFSAGNSDDSIGLEFKVDIAFTYLLIEDEIGDLHRELSSKYGGVITSRARDAIKNEAVGVTFTEYFRDRKTVEKRFAAAVAARWDEAPSLHCYLDQFHLARIQIPSSVAVKQLEAQIQNERNGMESFAQRAQLEREQTAVEVNRIGLETELVLRTAKAEADLLRARARSEADRIRALARIGGTQHLLETVGIDTEDQLSAFSYLRALSHRTSNISLAVTYLDPESVLRTTPA